MLSPMNNQKMMTHIKPHCKESSRVKVLFMPSSCRVSELQMDHFIQSLLGAKNSTTATTFYDSRIAAPHHFYPFGH
jgi:hypothetical protein